MERTISEKEEEADSTVPTSSLPNSLPVSGFTVQMLVDHYKWTWSRSVERGTQEQTHNTNNTVLKLTFEQEVADSHGFEHIVTIQQVFFFHQLGSPNEEKNS